jgi:hypothetical protein
MGYKLSDEKLNILKNYAEKYYDPHSCETNKNWKQEWEYVIKREYPWCGPFDLIQYKIHTMIAYFEDLKSNTFNYKYRITNKSINKQLKQMYKIAELGDKIFEDNYTIPVATWYDQNTDIIISFYRVTDFTKKYNGIPCNYLPEGFEKLGEMRLHGTDSTNVFINQLTNGDSNFGPDLVEEWCAKNGYSKDEVRFVYEQVWNNGKSEEENKLEWEQRLATAYKERKNDIKKYYSLLAKYADSWSD